MKNIENKFLTKVHLYPVLFEAVLFSVKKEPITISKSYYMRLDKYGIRVIYNSRKNTCIKNMLITFDQIKNMFTEKKI